MDCIDLFKRAAMAPVSYTHLDAYKRQGFCRAYHEKTGIAGYTLVYSSRTMSLRTHQPFESAEKAVKDNLDIISQKNILETENHRILVEDTDEGEVLRERVHDLKQLVAAYQLGWITETRCEDHIW